MGFEDELAGIKRMAVERRGAAVIAAYERGVGLYRRCQTALEQAELRVRLLSDPQDPASGQPFDPPASPDA